MSPRCACRNARAETLLALAADLDAMADRTEPAGAATPYIASTRREAACLARAKAEAIRDEGITPRIREYRVTRNPFDMP